MWCDLALSLQNRSVNAFVRMLQHYRYGIINHCDFPIHTGKPEGVNNKIKVSKRKAYGFHDLLCFTLKIHQAFSTKFGEEPYRKITENTAEVSGNRLKTEIRLIAESC